MCLSSIAAVSCSASYLCVYAIFLLWIIAGSPPTVDAVSFHNDDDYIPWQRSCHGLRYKNKCYLFVSSEDRWLTQKRFCSEAGYRLVQVESVDEADLLATEFSKTGFNYFWTSANDKEHEGVWVNIDRTAAFVQPLWNFQEPNGDWREDCGEMLTIGMKRGRLNDQKCGKFRRAVCEREADGHCPRVGLKDKCYLFSVHTTPYFEAVRQCKSVGMRLARALDQDILSFITAHQKATTWVDVTMGMPQAGATMLFGSMHPGLYGPRCSTAVAGRFEGKTGKRRCNSPAHYVCESTPTAGQTESVVDQAIDGPLPVHNDLANVLRMRRKAANTEKRVSSEEDLYLEDVDDGASGDAPDSDTLINPTVSMSTNIHEYVNKTLPVQPEEVTLLRYPANCDDAFYPCNPNESWYFY